MTLASLSSPGALKSILDAERRCPQHAQLERQFGSQLHGAVPSERVSHITEIACCTCAKALIRFIELGGIRHAEGLGAKLHAHTLFNRETAEHGGVQIEEVWSAESSAGHIPQNADCSLAKWPSALGIVDIVRGHIEPRLARTDAVQYLEGADQVRHLRIPRRVQN